MGPVYTPSMRNYDELISAMKSERNTFAAGSVLDRAREIIENWKKQHDEIRALLDQQGIGKDKPISVLVADKWATIDESDAAKWRMLEALRAPEGASVTFVCDNPDFGAGPRIYIEVCDNWTGWDRRSFPGESVKDCLDAALKARAAVTSDK